MNPKKFEAVINLPLEERYAYFIRKIAEFEEVWGLYNDSGWATLTDNNNTLVIPFWPEEEFALSCCSGQWEKYQPKSIPLDDFVNKWLTGMKKNNQLANVFYTPTNKNSIIIQPGYLKKDLDDEMKNYL